MKPETPIDRYLLPLLGGIVVLWFSTSLHFPFTALDDAGNVMQNPFVAGFSVRNIRWALTTFHMSVWHPLTWLSYMLDSTVFGTAPWGYRLSNILIHMVNACLLYWLMRRFSVPAIWSFLFSLLFAIHPLRYEAVIWISERKEILCAFFVLLSVHCYRSHVVTGRKTPYALSVSFHFLSLLSKPMSVTLPVLLALLDWKCPKEKTGNGIPILDKIPFLLLSIASAGMAVLGMRAHEAVVSTDTLPVWLRVANAANSFWLYLWKTVCPIDLSIFYQHPGHSIDLLLALGALAALVAVSAILLKYRDAGIDGIVVGWFWFLIALLPVSGLVQVTDIAMADRYTYIPHLGLFGGLAWQLGRPWSDGARLQTARRAAVAASALFLVWVAVTGSRQMDYWSENRKLFSRVVEISGPTPRNYNLLALACNVEGHYADAERFARLSVQGDPDTVHYRKVLADAYLYQGKYPAAIEELDRVIRTESPLQPDTLYNDAFARMRIGDRAGARMRLAALLEISPDDAEALAMYDRALRGEKGTEEVRTTVLRRIVDLRIAGAGHYLDLGALLADAGQRESAISVLQEGNTRFPGDPELAAALERVSRRGRGGGNPSRSR